MGEQMEQQIEIESIGEATSDKWDVIKDMTRLFNKDSGFSRDLPFADLTPEEETYILSRTKTLSFISALFNSLIEAEKDKKNKEIIKKNKIQTLNFLGRGIQDRILISRPRTGKIVKAGTGMFTADEAKIEPIMPQPLVK